MRKVFHGEAQPVTELAHFDVIAGRVVMLHEAVPVGRDGPHIDEQAEL